MNSAGTATTNDTVVRVIGMSRSGNHAIIDWILGQHSGNWLFLNCAEPGRNPFLSARPLDRHGTTYRTDMPRLRIEDEARGLFRRKSLLLYSHEDTFLKRACGRRANDLEPRFVGASARRVDLLILRDPFNLFASRRKARMAPVAEGVALRIWKQHAKAFLGDRRGGRELVPVSFNAWHVSSEYRRSLAARLGLRFSDAGFDQVAAVADGSSFDGRAYCGRASEMPVLQRWRSYADDPRFLALFDREVCELSREAFGALPAPA